MVNNKIFVFGGKKGDVLYDDILAFDLIKNECRIVSKLPYPLRYMSTVQLKDKVNITFQTQLKSIAKNREIQLKEIPISHREISFEKL